MPPAAMISGGHVRRLVWHPWSLSRTDVEPNPHPVFEIWAGPLFGAVSPLLLFVVLRPFTKNRVYLLEYFAAFCLLANGLYVGSSVVWPVGDARQLVRLGVSRGILGGFGIVASTIGTVMLDRCGSRLGFGRRPRSIRSRDVTTVLLTAIVLTAAASLIGVGVN